MGTSSPPTPSTTTLSAPTAASRASATSSAGSIGAPASSAARCGETGGPKRRATRARRPRREQRGRAATPGRAARRVPVTHRLDRRHPLAPRPQGRGERRGHTVLPTPVSVPVTKSAAQRPLRRFRERVAHRHAAAPARAASCAVTIGSAAPGWKPAAIAARDSVWAASRSSPRVCDAITARRSREVPSGTVGGRMAWAKTPALERRLAHRIARSASPTTSGTIWVVRAGDVEALARPARRAASPRWPGAARRGAAARASSSSAASAPPRPAAGGAVEKMSGRARVDEVLRHVRVAARRRRRRSRAPCPACPTMTSTSSLEPGLGDGAAAAGPEAPMPCASSTTTRHAVAAGELDDLGQRGDVAVHREHGVGDDERAAPVGLRAAPTRGGRRRSGVDERLGPREAAAVDDRGVVELVGEHDLAAAGQRATTTPMLAR